MTKTPEQQQQLSDALEPAVHVVDDQDDGTLEQAGDEPAKEEPAVQLDHLTRRNLWCSRLEKTPSREQCNSSWNDSGSRKKPNVDSDVPELDLQIEHLTDVAVMSGTTAWKRSNSWFTTCCNLCSVCSSDRLLFSNVRCLCSNSASGRACNARTSHLPARMLTTKRCGQLL